MTEMIDDGGGGNPIPREQAKKIRADLEAHGKQVSTGSASLDLGGASGDASSDQSSAKSEVPGDVLPETRRARATRQGRPKDAQVGDATARFEGQASGSPETAGVTVEVIGAAPTGPELTSARLGADTPSSSDELGFLEYAQAIARFLTHSDSKPPLTISIQAPWGGGKSSLMRMIQRELDASKRPELVDSEATKIPSSTTERLSVGELKRTLATVQSGSEPALPFVPKSTSATKQRVTVWFNAWKYESTNQVWAGLIDAILEQVPQRMTWKEREEFWALLNIRRIGVGRIRQRFYEHMIGLALRTSVGALRAALLAAGTAALVFFLPYFASVGQSLHSVLGWAVPISLAAKWHMAKSKANDEPVADVFKDLVEIPKYEEQLGFVHQVERDLKRVFECLPPNEGLVIFIDDLDRCTPTKVAAVLEAVNLFLAGDFQSCCFVIGMDTEMVAAALQVAHKDLVDKLPDGEATPLGWRFMDKFVQLPFVIPPLTVANRSNLMFHLLGREKKEGPELATTGATAEVNAPRASFDDEAEKSLLLQRDSDLFVTLATIGAAVLSRNPRELKRFINLLRFNYFLRFSRVRQGLPAPPPATLAKWTVLSVKWPEHARWLRHVRDRGIPDGKLAEYIPEREGRDLWHHEPNHLLLLETLAKRCTHGEDLRAPRLLGVGHDKWRDGLTSLYEFREKAPAWLADTSLLDFYADSPSRKTEGVDTSLSGNINTGFW